MLKPLPAASAALLLNALLLLPAAHATTFNTDAAATHGHWQSLTLSLGEERHYRAMEASSYGDALFSVNLSAGQCASPWLELRVDLGERQPQSRVVNRVPADLRLIRAHNLRVDEAVLTGESEPVEKGTNPVAPEADLADRTGMAYSGTLVAAGQGRGVVVATGVRTQIGRISRMVGQVESVQTP
ncbi:MAG: hypothetical protein ACOC0M_03345, partial [Halomonas sp.]